MQIRLNKLLADLGLASRRKADELIAAGQVLLNGKPAKLGEQVDPQTDQIKFNGRLLSSNQAEPLEYWLLHKPRGVLSTVSDEQGRRSVNDLLAAKSQARLFPVGRLDADSEGLLLMTNDGELAYRLTHPKYEVSKTYKVWATGIFAPSKVERLLRGVRLREGLSRADRLELLEKDDRELVFQISIHQGRKHEVRRMFAKVGWEVTRLLRTDLAGVLQLELAPGNARRLRAEEIAALRQLVGL